MEESKIKVQQQRKKIAEEIQSAVQNLNPDNPSQVKKFLIHMEKISEKMAHKLGNLLYDSDLCCSDDSDDSDSDCDDCNIQLEIGDS